jgi:hypothetical protein
MAMCLQVVLFACFILMAGCTTTDYLGKTYPPRSTWTSSSAPGT